MYLSKFTLSHEAMKVNTINHVPSSEVEGEKKLYC